MLVCFSFRKLILSLNLLQINTEAGGNLSHRREVLE